jgi:hypothetical protein
VPRFLELWGAFAARSLDEKVQEYQTAAKFDIKSYKICDANGKEIEFSNHFL